MVASASELRRDFLLRDDVVFLNHGSFGACPRPVFDRYQAWQRELESQPVEFLGRRAAVLLAEARKSLGEYLGADADDIVYFPNVTHALNVVVRSLPINRGDEVLATNHEYGALERTWRFVCAQRGAKYVAATLPYPLPDADSIIDALWSAVTERTRVIFLSHMTSPTAVMFPVAEIARRARAKGIWCVVDGAHIPGHYPLDLDAIGADFYGGNCHKWLCAPKGAGFLYARKSAQSVLSPLVVSWGWQSRTPGPSRFVDEQEQQGTRDLAAYLSVPAAITYQSERNWSAVRERCHGLVSEARRRVAELTGLPPFHPDGTDWFIQMAALPLPKIDVAKLKNDLYERFAIEIPVLTWRERNFVRISIQGYNDERDIGALLDALAKLI